MSMELVQQTLPSTAPPPSRWQRAVDNFADFLNHVRRRWILYLPVFALWGLAYVRLFIDPTPRLPLLFNWTPSLPYRAALLMQGAGELHRGDYVVFAFAGEAQATYPGLRGQPFFKIVRGLPGDAVTVHGRVVAIDNETVGVAKTHAYDGRPLTPITPMRIPPGYFYVQGTSPDSFDSRYAASGLIRADQVIGHALPLF